MEKRNISIYWLIDKMITKKHTDSELNDIFNKAKAMHKEEIIRPLISMGWSEEIAESHYNVIYGGNNEN